jgi:NADPH:quinone reductase-like Zn-dependent oxidoreductase
MQTQTRTYKAFQIETFGLTGLREATKEIQNPTGTKVLVRMRAASLNYRDLMVAKGVYSKNLPLPLIPLSDGAGEVVEVGEAVTRWKVGDRVAPIFMQSWIAGEVSPEIGKSALGGGIDGVLREYGLFDQDGLVAIPGYLSFEEAATLPCAAVTAWHALVTKGGIKSGDSVLVMGTGGVSIFALQIAKLSGARVIATSSSDAKMKKLKELGASDTINYKEHDDWDRKVTELTGGRGVDHVVEVGGAGTLDKSMRAVRMAGYIAMIGVLSGAGSADPRPLVMKTIHLQGIYVGSRAMFEDMLRAFEMHKVRPVIDKTFKMEQVKEALEYMESGKHFGKIVLTL